MAEKEFIEREALIKSDDWQSLKNDFDKARAHIIILAQPAADVVEVVRCKDCKHRYVPARCALWYATMNDKEYFVERGENFYCSYGERRTEQ